MDTSDDLLKKSGFLKCQLLVTDYVMAQQKDLNRRIKAIQQVISEEPGLLARQEHINEFYKLCGELEALEKLWNHVYALLYADSTTRLS